MVRRVLEVGRHVSVVAAEQGVSPRTVFKWLRRYREFGEVGLRDRTSRPGVIRHQLNQDWVDLIVELRTEYRMTAQRIATQLKLARSTVSGVLKREGISRLEALEPVAPVQRYEHARPGDMIHIDIKKLGRFERAGHRVTGNRLPSSTGPGWEYVHVCIDDHSRVAYAEVLPNQRKESAVAFLRRAAKWFQRFGITIKRVLTDNGSCYKSSLWHKTCAALEISVKKTRPYRPQTNGKAERFIQTLLREWAYARAFMTSNDRMDVLPLFLIHYNEHRNHSSLGNRPPITRMPTVNNAHGIHN